MADFFEEIGDLFSSESQEDFGEALDNTPEEFKDIGAGGATGAATGATAAGPVGAAVGFVIGGIIGLEFGEQRREAEQNQKNRKSNIRTREARARQEARTEKLALRQTERRFSESQGGQQDSPSALSTLATASPSAGGLNTQGSKTSGTF